MAQLEWNAPLGTFSLADTSTLFSHSLVRHQVSLGMMCVDGAVCIGELLTDKFAPPFPSQNSTV